MAEGQAPVGSYLVVGDGPARASGVAYSWSVPLTIVAGKSTTIELTNANASADSTIAQNVARSGRKVEEITATYRRVRRGVFRIEAGAATGSGFLADSAAGLVVTNAHVVQGQLEATVVMDSVTRVPAVVLSRSQTADVAVLQINPEAAVDRPALELANPLPGQLLVEEGERVFAIGFPLNQEQVLTTGIVSGIRNGAIISDVNINHGNSGGPMLNYGGVVVGVNTFGDFTTQGGPGISGAILAPTAWPLLEQARRAAQDHEPPPFIRLPTMPLTSYPLSALQAYVATLPAKRLKEYNTDANGRFDVVLATPPSLSLSMLSFDDEVAHDRRRREAAAGLSAEQRYSSLQDVRDWSRFTGDQLTPVIQITVTPKIGETTGSAIGRAFSMGLTGYNPQATLRFKGDAQSVEFYRNGVLATPIRGGTAPVEVYQNDRWVSLKDVANVGYFVLDPLLFAPDTSGTPPSIVILVNDLKHSSKPSCRELKGASVAAVWNDFRPYYQEQAPEYAALVADPSRKPKLFTSSGIPEDSVATADPDKTWKEYWPECPSVTY
jgi:S1-C subfamily serine protease